MCVCLRALAKHNSVSEMRTGRVMMNCPQLPQKVISCTRFSVAHSAPERVVLIVLLIPD